MAHLFDPLLIDPRLCLNFQDALPTAELPSPLLRCLHSSTSSKNALELRLQQEWALALLLAGLQVCVCVFVKGPGTHSEARKGLQVQQCTYHCTRRARLISLIPPADSLALISALLRLQGPTDGVLYQRRFVVQQAMALAQSPCLLDQTDPGELQRKICKCRSPSDFLL